MCVHTKTETEREARYKNTLSHADLYLDKSNCDKVTLQLQKSMEVIYLPHQAISALSSESGREGGREEERETEGDLASMCEWCVN